MNSSVLSEPNAKQREAIERTAAEYRADPDVEFLGWKVIDASDVNCAADGTLWVQYSYRDLNAPYMGDPNRPSHFINTYDDSGIPAEDRRGE